MADSIRIDRWLWYARFFKSRTLAAKVCTSGRVRVNRQTIEKAHLLLKIGDTVSFPQARTTRVVKLVAFGSRRGPAPEAESLYEDHTPVEPVVPKEEMLEARERGLGRPTKRERRRIDRFRRG